MGWQEKKKLLPRGEREGGRWWQHLYHPSTPAQLVDCFPFCFHGYCFALPRSSLHVITAFPLTSRVLGSEYCTTVPCACAESAQDRHICRHVSHLLNLSSARSAPKVRLVHSFETSQLIFYVGTYCIIINSHLTVH